jgi:DNA polymerase-3 subunit gamma/tau
MVASIPPNSSGETTSSLYRRFRPGTFGELRGQDHIVAALQGAVKNNRVAHTYLFSGPRGTGKTTTARILAKALNCEHRIDGDACNTCASCVAITKGSSLDVTELDAASNNGIENIRDITSGAWHGTPGRWKVYIFDEVHQLSKAASSALLKTLEEPPSHVIFVLATTDPHKVLPTIRSRAQHLEFRLLNADVLRALLHEVSTAAGLKVDDATINAAVRLGHGSARDALSALDQLLATGSIAAAQPEFEGLFGALHSGDATAAFQSLAELAREGWDPEQLAENFAGELRQAFLLQVAPDVADVVGEDRERLAMWGRELGLPKTVRALETIGRSLREMHSAVNKTVMLEIALARLTVPELDDTVAALDERLSRLERSTSTSVSTPAPAPAPSRPIGSAAPTEKTTSSKEQTAREVSNVASSDNAKPETVEQITPPAAADALGDVSFADFVDRFQNKVLAKVSRGAQSVLKSAAVKSVEGNVLTIAVPSESMRQGTDQIQGSLQSALSNEFARPFSVVWVVDASIEMKPLSNIAAPRAPRPTVHDVVEMHDDDVATSNTIETDSVADHLIAEVFPGAKEVS